MIKELTRKKTFNNTLYTIMLPFTIEEDRNYIDELVHIPCLFKEFKEQMDEKINQEMKDLIRQMLFSNQLIKTTPK